jgi:GH15 family glucan-1,4-alpha-glucosidase
VVGTVAAIQRRLLDDGLVQRYDTAATDDGLPPEEGAFLACSFWLVDNLVLQGKRDEAIALFERLLALRNDVGLLAEEYDTRSRRQVGNFPQAFSHIALINSALNLTRAAGPTKQRAKDEQPAGDHPGHMIASAKRPASPDEGDARDRMLTRPRPGAR